MTNSNKRVERYKGDSRYLELLDVVESRISGLLNEMATLHERKAADYGRPEDSLANMRRAERLGIPPWLLAVARFEDKVSRIETYCKTRKLENENFEDSLADAAAYALIALVLFREEAAK